MKKFRSVAFALIIAVVSTLSIIAQTQQKAPFKIGLINTMAFGEDKTGINKYAAAKSSVDAEFKKEIDDLTAAATRVQNLEKELIGMQKQITPAPGQTVSPLIVNTYNTKLEEYERLGRDYKFKQEDVRKRYQRRRQAVMGPVLIDLGKAMQEFAKQRGFSLIIDGAKLSDSGVLLGWDEKIDLTKDFITFYNARPATAAATVPVK